MSRVAMVQEGGFLSRPVTRTYSTANISMDELRQLGGMVVTGALISGLLLEVAKRAGKGLTASKATEPDIQRDARKHGMSIQQFLRHEAMVRQAKDEARRRTI